MGKTILSNSLVFLFLAASLFAQASVDVGDMAPDFELRDAAGNSYKLSSYRGEKAVVLEEIEAQGAVLLGISKYDAAETASWLEEQDWTFAILADGGPAIEAYGLLNPDVSRDSMKGIPHPATIIIDKDGKVRFVNVWVDYRQRTSPATIIEELKKIQ